VSQGVKKKATAFNKASKVIVFVLLKRVIVLENVDTLI